MAHPSDTGDARAQLLCDLGCCRGRRPPGLDLLTTRPGRPQSLYAIKLCYRIAAAQWRVKAGHPNAPTLGRVCVLRNSEDQARRALRKIREKAQRGGPEPNPETLAYANYVIVFTTLSDTELSAKQVL